MSADDEPPPPVKSDPHQLMSALKTKLSEGLGPSKFAQEFAKLQVQIGRAQTPHGSYRCALSLPRAMAPVRNGAPCARTRASSTAQRARAFLPATCSATRYRSPSQVANANTWWTAQI